jgi:hypothetical protein
MSVASGCISKFYYGRYVFILQKIILILKITLLSARIKTKWCVYDYIRSTKHSIKGHSKKIPVKV